MVSASILARAGNLFLAGCFALTFAMMSCTSPLDIDVDRTKSFSDGSVHPLRLSLFYYFGDSAYEAIVTDTSFLNSIWIEPSSGMFEVTIPNLQFNLPDSARGAVGQTPFVKSFCFSSNRKPSDGSYSSCMSANSWIAGVYLDDNDKWQTFHWPADDRGRQIRLAYYHVEGQKLVKGVIQILVLDPKRARYESYRAVISMEY